MTNIIKVPKQLAPLMKPVDSIYPCADNPRVGHDVRLIADKLKRLGWHAPIVARENGEIVIGHGRLKAALSLGAKSVPVLTVDDSKAMAIERMVSDNRTGELSDWDYQALLDLDLDLENEGWSLAEINRINEEINSEWVFPEIEDPIADDEALYSNGNDLVHRAGVVTILISSEDSEEVERALDSIIKAHHCTRGEALSMICRGHNGAKKDQE